MMEGWPGIVEAELEGTELEVVTREVGYIPPEQSVCLIKRCNNPNSCQTDATNHGHGKRQAALVFPLIVTCLRI